MADQSSRDKIIDLVKKMRANTVDNGCTPGEAAKFAAKVAEWIEKYQLSEAELSGAQDADSIDIEPVQNYLKTGKKVFNPGHVAVVSALSRAMCCNCIMLPAGYWTGEERLTSATFGIIGSALDADYVCQIAATVCPALEMLGRLEGAEHGYERAELMVWTNQFLQGAAYEIEKRIEAERKTRSEIAEAEHMLTAKNDNRGLMCITGLVLAQKKREVAESAFKEAYPETRKSRIGSTRKHLDGAFERGQEAGKTIGLHIGVEDKG